LDTTTEYWLAEIHRLLAPGGKAFLTFHDETLFEEIAGSPAVPDVPKGTKLISRYVVGSDTLEGGAAMGTFYTTEVWEKILEKYFTVERTVPRGLFGHQSFSVVTKKAVSIDRALLDREYMGLLEQQLFDLRKAYRVLF
jgi:hypothetical protein